MVVWVVPHIRVPSPEVSFLGYEAIVLAYITMLIQLCLPSRFLGMTLSGLERSQNLEDLDNWLHNDCTSTSLLAPLLLSRRPIRYLIEEAARMRTSILPVYL